MNKNFYTRTPLINTQKRDSREKVPVNITLKEEAVDKGIFTFKKEAYLLRFTETVGALSFNAITSTTRL